MNTHVPSGSGFTLTNAVGVNNDGQIIAKGSANATGLNRGLPLTLN